jgi:hypothetical protein
VPSEYSLLVSWWVAFANYILVSFDIIVTHHIMFRTLIQNHGWIITDDDSVDHENHLKTIYFLANQFKGRVQFIHLPKHNEAYLKQFDVDISMLYQYLNTALISTCINLALTLSLLLCQSICLQMRCLRYFLWMFRR